MTRANQLELVVAMALARISLLRALLPSKRSWRTTRGVSCAPSGAAAARSNANATAATPLTEAPWPGDEGCEGAGARLTTCSKPGSLTTLRLHVNVRAAPRRRAAKGPEREGPAFAQADSAAAGPSRSGPFAAGLLPLFHGRRHSRDFLSL